MYKLHRIISFSVRLHKRYNFFHKEISFAATQILIAIMIQKILRYFFIPDYNMKVEDEVE